MTMALHPDTSEEDRVQFIKDYNEVEVACGCAPLPKRWGKTKASLTEILDYFIEDEIDDFQIVKVGNEITFGYFNENPARLCTVTDGKITHVAFEGKKLGWLDFLYQEDAPIVNDFEKIDRKWIATDL